MGRSPRCSKDGWNKGAWTAAEDQLLADYINIHGEGKWSNVTKQTGLKRCGKSCRLRWMNYLRPDIKRGNISEDEEELIIRLHKLLGNKWSLIAGRLPGRTDNEIKNYWNTNLAKKAQVQLQSPAVLPENIEKRATKRSLDETSPDLGRANPISQRPRVNLVASPPRYIGYKDQNPFGSNVAVATEPSPDGNLLKKATDESESSEGSPSSTTLENENSSDFMVDFNVDDICKFLDSDFTKLAGDIHMISESHNVVNEGEGDDDMIIGCNPMKRMEENWSSGSEFFQIDMTSQMLSLASSFLESAEEWPGDDLNVIDAQ